MADDDDDEAAFLAFLKRCDEVIEHSTETGLGREDFADAPWRDLFEDLGPECTDEDIIDCLADSDDTYAELHRLSKGKGDGR